MSSQISIIKQKESIARQKTSMARQKNNVRDAILKGGEKELSYKMFFKAFSNSTRFELIRALRKKPMNVGQLCEETGFEQSRISHNLRCLVAVGFVEAARDGKCKVYKLHEESMLPILNSIDLHIRKYGQRLRTCGVLKDGKNCQYVHRV